MSVTMTNIEPARANDAVDAGESADPALMSTAQRDQITRVLRQVSGNKAAAAKQLGISRRSLYRWLDRLNIPQ
jgi:transcriptional regulator with PAS, ATPase and Fis domain